MLRQAGDFGIRSGITIPIRTAFGHMFMLTVASHKPSLSLERDIDQQGPRRRKTCAANGPRDEAQAHPEHGKSKLRDLAELHLYAPIV
ncbi:MAG: hypothetical protein E5W19_10345 [Mesorhizobium sp.]|nr:MAG: hypothetical protein E5W19_10345 [Mesorhizobium sp.]